MRCIRVFQRDWCSCALGFWWPSCGRASAVIRLGGVSNRYCRSWYGQKIAVVHPILGEISLLFIQTVILLVLWMSQESLEKTFAWRNSCLWRSWRALYSWCVSCGGGAELTTNPHGCRSWWWQGVATGGSWSRVSQLVARGLGSRNWWLLERHSLAWSWS